METSNPWYLEARVLHQQVLGSQDPELMTTPGRKERCVLTGEGCPDVKQVLPQGSSPF